jgi:hypothetical protein
MDLEYIINLIILVLISIKWSALNVEVLVKR